MRKLLCSILLLTLGTFGCNDRTDTRVTAPPVDPPPDTEIENERGVFRLYDSNNAHAIDILEKTIDVDFVRVERERFELAGYRYRADNSFVADAVLSNGRAAEVTILAMENTTAPEEDAVFLFVLRGTSRQLVIATKLVQAGSSPGPEYQALGSGLWLGGIDPLLDPRGLEGSAARFSARQFASCMTLGLAAGLARCIYGCRFALLAFNQCMVGCAGTTFIFTLFVCVFEQV